MSLSGELPANTHTYEGLLAGHVTVLQSVGMVLAMDPGLEKMAAMERLRKQTLKAWHHWEEKKAFYFAIYTASGNTAADVFIRHEDIGIHMTHLKSLLEVLNNV